MAKIRLIIVFLLILLSIPNAVFAQKEAGASATFSGREQSNTSTVPTYDLQLKRKVIYDLLSKNGSPLASETDSFIETCTKYRLDCYLLPSIAGLESSFGKHILWQSHNPFGWGGGYLVYNTWQDCINAVGNGLRENYINKGADTIEKIAPIYAASPTWAVRVQKFHDQFVNLEDEKRLYFSKVEVEL